MSQAHRYRIVRPIGRDAHGVVYQADQLDRWGKIAAQRALVVFDAANQPVVERLRALAPRLRGARLSGISRLDEIIRFQGRWGGLRELQDGLDAGTLVRYEPLPTLVVAEVGARVATALHQAYGLPGPDGRPQRLLHGSVRPENLFVTDRGQVLLLNFGAVGAEPTDGRVQLGQTWDFVAPERWRGAHGRAGEVYSVGSVLYHLLTGEMFGRAAATREEHQRRLDRVLPRVASHGDGWAEALGSMLDWGPELRPTALEVHRVLTEVIGDRMGTLRAWAQETVPALRRRHTLPEPDELCNLVFEATDVSEVDLGPGDGIMGWDDVTSSYPLGALRRRFAENVHSRPVEPRPALDPTPSFSHPREAEPLEDLLPARPRGPYFVLFVVSLGVAVVLLGAVAAVLALLAMGFLQTG